MITNLTVRTATLSVQKIGYVLWVRPTRTRDDVVAKRRVLQWWLERHATTWTLGPVDVRGPFPRDERRPDRVVVGVVALGINNVPEQKRDGARAFLATPSVGVAFQYREWVGEA